MLLVLALFELLHFAPVLCIKDTIWFQEHYPHLLRMSFTMARNEDANIVLQRIIPRAAFGREVLTKELPFVAGARWDSVSSHDHEMKVDVWDLRKDLPLGEARRVGPFTLKTETESLGMDTSIYGEELYGPVSHSQLPHKAGKRRPWLPILWNCYPRNFRPRWEPPEPSFGEPQSTIQIREYFSQCIDAIIGFYEPPKVFPIEFSEHSVIQGSVLINHDGPNAAAARRQQRYPRARLIRIVAEDHEGIQQVIADAIGIEVYHYDIPVTAYIQSLKLDRFQVCVWSEDQDISTEVYQPLLRL